MPRPASLPVQLRAARCKVPRLSTVARSPGSNQAAALAATVSRSKTTFLPYPKRARARSAGVSEASTEVKVLRLTSEQLESLRAASAP